MNWYFYAALFARGVCIGIADLIPGVSGGTIAFISGIYQRLLSALSAFTTLALWRALAAFQLRRVWQLSDAAFLLALAAGILTAVLLFSSLLHHWLETQAHLLFGFFFGMVIASIIAITRRLNKPAPLHIAAAVAAAGLTFYLVNTDAVTLAVNSKAALFAGGMIAICAMLLPGISGSYILLILGLYPTVINAVHERDIATLVIFSAGCGAGLLAFSRLLSLLLEKFYNAVIIVLIGVMVGALPKLWPWKETASDIKIILQPNVMPEHFTGDADVILVVLLAVAGIAAVLLIDRLARHKRRLD